jgi:hypothetical protein
MILVNLEPKFDPSPFLTKPIDYLSLETKPFRHFDKDGYEVPTTLERMFYEAEGVELNNEIQYHVAPVQEWFTDTEYSERFLVLDHCMLLTRYALAEEAREQVERAVKNRPILNKLLGIKPKWGIDFSLDYIDHDIVMEVIHIEQDFDNVDEAIDAKERLEKIIETTDWYDGAASLWRKKDEWMNLSSDDHSDYKAQYFGWHRAFDNKKVFAT